MKKKNKEVNHIVIIVLEITKKKKLPKEYTSLVPIKTVKWITKTEISLI